MKLLTKKLKKEGLIFNFYQQEFLINNKVVDFDLIEHNGAVGVLLIDNQDFVLVEQFRYPLQKNIIEILAGKIEKNETDYKKTLRRECQEELGVEIKNIKFLDVITPSGGVCSEKIYLYVATIKNYDQMTNFDFSEDVVMKKIKQEEALEMVLNNQIIDGKTIYTIMRYFNERNKNKI